MRTINHPLRITNHGWRYQPRQRASGIPWTIVSPKGSVWVLALIGGKVWARPWHDFNGEK